jgi:hypothetical protein
VDLIFEPFGLLVTLSDDARQKKTNIVNSRDLTTEGKRKAATELEAAARAAIKDWHEKRLAGIDADLTAQRAALFGLIDRPDPKRVDLMASRLLTHTPADVQVFYGSASPSERLEMESANAMIGRVPLKGPNGLEWKTLLDPAMVAEAQLSRAEQTNPAAAEKVRELQEIRDMQVTLIGVALSEI